MKLGVWVTCTECTNTMVGCLTFDDVMGLVDSDGGIVFEDGWRCHKCLGEPYLSEEMTL